MRIGLIGIGTFALILFLVTINYSSVSPEELDAVFEDVDVNTLDKIGEDTSGDVNLMKFVKYTAKGVVQEFHGTYYLASWLNTFLPEWVIQNLELIIILAILAFISPLVFYLGLTIIAVSMIIHEKIEQRRGKKA